MSLFRVSGSTPSHSAAAAGLAGAGGPEPPRKLTRVSYLCTTIFNASLCFRFVKDSTKCYVAAAFFAECRGALSLKLQEQTICQNDIVSNVKIHVGYCHCTGEIFIFLGDNSINKA